MTETQVGLLSDDERADLEAVIAGLSAAEAAYVEGWVGVLCRERALELAADVAGEAARKAASEA